MKLTYWIANCMDDSQAYSIRRKTKKAVVEALEAHDDEWKMSFSPPHKVTVEYKDSFELMMECMQEGSGYWESSPFDVYERYGRKYQFEQCRRK